MRKSILFPLMLIASATASSAAEPVSTAQPVPTFDGILDNSPLSCFYLLMHTYHEQLNLCRDPLDQAHEERFSRMSTAIENYIKQNARLDPDAIINNAKGAAAHAVQGAPECGTQDFNDIRQAMHNFTSERSEARLDAQLATNALAANGSCY